MGRIKEEHLEFAKDLYTQYNNEGEKLYSLQEIADKVEQKFHKKFTRQTIWHWAKSNDWDGLSRKIVQYALNRVHEEEAKKNKFTPDEKIIDARSKDLAEVYKYAKLMVQISTDVYQKSHRGEKHTNIRNNEAIQAFKAGSNVMLRLNDIPDPESNLGTGIILMPDNKR